MQKLWAPGSQRAPKSQEFLLEDDWLLLTSPKGQTAHQSLLTNLSAFFLPRFITNAHAVLTGWMSYHQLLTVGVEESDHLSEGTNTDADQCGSEVPQEYQTKSSVCHFSTTYQHVLPLPSEGLAPGTNGDDIGIVMSIVSSTFKGCFNALDVYLWLLPWLHSQAGARRPAFILQLEVQIVLNSSRRLPTRGRALTMVPTSAILSNIPFSSFDRGADSSVGLKSPHCSSLCDPKLFWFAATVECLLMQPNEGQCCTCQACLWVPPLPWEWAIAPATACSCHASDFWDQKSFIDLDSSWKRSLSRDSNLNYIFQDRMERSLCRKCVHQEAKESGKAKSFWCMAASDES